MHDHERPTLAATSSLYLRVLCSEQTRSSATRSECGARAMAEAGPSAPKGARPMVHIAGVVNNPRPATWLEYFGLPDDIDEWTIDDVRGSVTSLMGQTPGAAAGEGAAGIGGSASRRELTLADFATYLARVGEPYRFFDANRPSASAPAGADDAGGAGSGASASGEELAHRLDGVPELLFRADFDLTDPRTFATFAPDAQPSAASAVTIERLAQHLDRVELTLLAEVSARAEGFFDALKTHERLAAEVASAVAELGAMRSRLRQLEENLVHAPMRLPRLVRRRANVLAALEKAQLAHAVVRTQPTIASLLASSDFPAALELIRGSQQLLDDDLKGVHALAPVRASLASTQARIAIRARS